MRIPTRPYPWVGHERDRGGKNRAGTGGLHRGQVCGRVQAGRQGE
jgi:hypothetical protein